MQLDPFFQPSHHDLIYELERAGFRRLGTRVWDGVVTDAATGVSWPVRVEFKDDYPERPPTVTRRDDAPLTWHQNADQSLCLYSQTSPGEFPWFHPGGLLRRIREWLLAADAGWSGEPPDLDLERYWSRSERIDLIIHPAGLQHGMDLRLRKQHGGRVLVWAGHQRAPKNRGKSHQYLYGHVVDAGDLETPPRTWEQLRPLISEAENVDALLRARRLDVLLVLYRQCGQQGVLGLLPFRSKSGWDFNATTCAEDSEAVRGLRRGPVADQLASRSVAVVGVGAIGSFIADGLYRCGIGGLTLIDHDRLRPGNLVRHAADGALVGIHKGEAMVRTLGARADRAGGVMQSQPQRVSSLEDAQHLDTHDLVVESTGNEVTTQLLAEAARRRSRCIVSAYLANAGRSKVVELLPTDRPRVSVSPMEKIAVEGVESGCGDPVSPTPPVAVQEVAAIACRVAIELLTGPADSAVSELVEHP